MEKDLIQAKKYLSEQGYGNGTNYTTNLVAVLLANYAASHPPAAPVSGEELTERILQAADEFIEEHSAKSIWNTSGHSGFISGAKWALSATLPTREQGGEKEKFAIRFSEWLMIQCEYKNHCVWEYQGEEYTQNELIEIFKRTTPLPSPPKH